MKQSPIRYLQGERRGMGSQLRPPTKHQLELAEIARHILIQVQVQLADVSFWQETIDFNVMKAAGIRGAIIRAGQRNWEDKRFKENWRKAKEAGVPRGSYFFYDSRQDPGSQAALWWSLVQGDTGELVHVADLEESYGGAFGSIAHVKAFQQRFQELSGLPDDRIAVYTGYWWWLERAAGDPWFRRYGLWLASYGLMSAARIPPPWTEPDLLFWQYTSSGNGAQYGVSSKEIDLNWYCCDETAFKKRFPLISNPTEEPVTEYIYRITPTSSVGSKVRPEPDTGNTSNLTLPFGKSAYGNRRVTIAEDKFEGGVQVNKAGDVWLEVLEVNGTLLPQPGYIAEMHLGQRYAVITQINTPPAPEPQPAEEIVITQTFSSPGYVSQTVTTTLRPE